MQGVPKARPHVPVETFRRSKSLCTLQVGCRGIIRFENEGASEVQPLPDRLAAAVLAASIRTALRFLTVLN
jgi:hypothetical protein